jgi:Flp pilus assembly pilin Flp
MNLTIHLTTHFLKTLRRSFKDTTGQDLIEYALMAGFVAVAAGAIMPSVAEDISQIFSSIGSVISGAAAEGN